MKGTTHRPRRPDATPIGVAPGEPGYWSAWRYARRLDVITELGGKCRECGYSASPHALCLIRPKDGSYEDIPQGSIRNRAVKDILEGNATGFDLLCANCRAITRYTRDNQGNQG